jgi:hypothetical protein
MVEDDDPHKALKIAANSAMALNTAQPTTDLFEQRIYDKIQQTACATLSKTEINPAVQAGQIASLEEIIQLALMS